MYYLVELRVRDFSSYRGFHIFSFDKGFNLALGSCGSGKTNLIRALEFALFGWTRDRSDRSLINYLHREDCEKREATPGCEVSAVFRCDGRDFTVKRKLLDFGDGLKKIMIIDSDIIDLISPEGFERMVNMERDIESLRGLSRGESTPIIMLNALARNFDDGRGMVFLDGVFGRHARTRLEGWDDN